MSKEENEMVIDVFVRGDADENDIAHVHRRACDSSKAGDYEILEAWTIWEYVEDYGLPSIGQPYSEDGDPVGPPDSEMQEEAEAFLREYPVDVTVGANLPVSLHSPMRGPNDVSGYRRGCRAWRDRLREDQDETAICPSCDGSGEGPADGTVCAACRGSGVTLTESGESAHKHYLEHLADARKYG